jgi:DNA invertase Pin-like site-specific DNA recombinase
LAEFERAIIIERTGAGLKAAKARGVQLGPQTVTDPGADQARSQVVSEFRQARVISSRLCRRCIQLRRWRELTAIRPTRPMAKRATVEGSETTAGIKVNVTVPPKFSAIFTLRKQ